MIWLRLLVVLLIACWSMGTLVSCGNIEELLTPATATPEPPLPTITPVPLPTLEPTPEWTATPEPTPTPERVPPVDMSNTTVYTHPVGIFSLLLPESWQVAEETSNDEGHRVRWEAPEGNAIVWVEVISTTALLQPAAETIWGILPGRITEQFATEAGIIIGKETEQPDGSIRLPFHVDTDVRGIPTRMLGTSFIQEQGQVVSIMTILVPDEQFDEIEAPLTALVNSLRLAEEIALVGQPVRVAIEPLVPYTHPTGRFSMQAPAHWQEYDESMGEELVTRFIDPNEVAMVEVRVAPADALRSPELRGQILREEVEERYKAGIFRFNTVVGEAEPQPDGSIRVIVNYDEMVRGIQTGMLGTSVLRRYDDIGVDVTVTAVVPRQQFALLRGALEEMVMSVQPVP